MSHLLRAPEDSLCQKMGKLMAARQMCMRSKVRPGKTDNISSDGRVASGLVPSHLEHCQGTGFINITWELWEMQILRPGPRSAEPTYPSSHISRWLMSIKVWGLRALQTGCLPSGSALTASVTSGKWFNILKHPIPLPGKGENNQTDSLSSSEPYPTICIWMVNTELVTGKCPINASNGY